MACATRHRAFAEEAKDDLIPAAVLHAERRAGRQGQVGSDDGIAAHESPRHVYQVHGSALALAQPSAATEKFGHHRLGVRASGQAMAMVAVSREHIIDVAKGIDSTECHRFFADIEMAEAAELDESVLRGAPLFKTWGQLNVRICSQPH